MITRISVLFIASILTVGSCKKEVPQVVEVPLRPVKFAQVKSESHLDDRVFSGTAKSSMESKLSFKVSGTIDRLMVEIGDRVALGQLIAAIDPVDYNLQYEQAKANLKSVETQIKSAESNLTNSRSMYQRIEKLYENNSLPLSEFEQAKAQFETAKASYDAAIAQHVASEKAVESAKNQVKYSSLTSPFPGVISRLHIEENELVASGNPIVTLSSLGLPEVHVGVPEILISDLKPGLPASVRFPNIQHKEFQSIIKEVGYTSDGSTYPVVVSLSENDETIRPGMPAEVSFIIERDIEEEEERIIIPTSSVGEDMNGRFVLLVVKESEERARIEKKYIEIGDLHNNGFEVKTGLESGMLIATAGLNTLLEGDRVRIDS